MKNHEKIKKKTVESSYKAIQELDKVLNQPIDLAELDPEKAKQAVQGKIEAQKGIFDMLARIRQEEEDMGERAPEVKKQDFKVGPENFR